MATYYSPKITTDGLVFCVDAANNKSYAGSGTTWYDLSGNSNNLSWSSPAPAFTAGICRTTNIASSLRAVISSTYTNLRTLTNPYTAYAVFKPNSTTSNKILFSFGPANNNCGGENVHPIAIGANGKFSGGSCGGLGTWSSSTGVAPTTSKYWAVATTYDGTTEILYVDGVFDKSASMSTSTPVSANNKISLGWIRDDGASYTMDADIGMILVYNRVLTATEQLQNYNATKARFAL